VRSIAALLLVCLSPALAQERPAQFTHAARVEAAGDEAHYRFTLPPEAYRGVTRADLGDLRVFNGAGEPVPYAFVPARPVTQEPATRPTKLFPLHGDRTKGLEGLNVRVRQSASGTLVDVRSSPGAPGASRKLLGYLLDASALEVPFEALVLDWQPVEGFNGTARVEASDDLRSWRVLAGAAPVLHLQHAGERLERKRVELHGARAKYLRVSFSGVPARFALSQARIELRPERAEPARQWLSIAGKESTERPGEYEFDTGGTFPVDRLRFALPQVNTVARAQVLHRARADEPWRAAAGATLYRLRRDGAEVTNADVAVGPAAARHWLLRVDQRGGGLGGGEVRLEIGWVPHEVVFAARGAGPFSLAYGMKIAKPGALPIAAVLPDYKEGEALKARLASLAAVESSAPRGASGLSEYFRVAVESGEAKKWALWASLVAGVLLLVWMAFALLRQVGKPK
jgi:hypothetical protein